MRNARKTISRNMLLAQLLFGLAATGCVLLPNKTPFIPPPGIAATSTTPTSQQPSTATSKILPAILSTPEVLQAQKVEPTQSTSTLELVDVLSSVDSHAPLLLAINEERTLAQGNAQAAFGAFDTNFRIRGITQDGSFPNNRVDAFFEQNLTSSGLSFFGGYRLGTGDFPVYYGDRSTADGGEFRGGVLLPLLRDSSIDRRRFALRQAQISVNLADPIIRRVQIELQRAAARSYWAWVAAGDQLRVANALLKLATQRQTGFENQFKAGAIDEFRVIDNKRLIAEREGALIAAERRVQQTALELSFFYRDDQGNPLIPTDARLPNQFLSEQPEKPDLTRTNDQVEQAYRNRPELVRFTLQKEAAALELELANNQYLPNLSTGVAGAVDMGKGKKGEGIFQADRQNLEAFLQFDMPLQRNEAQGRQTQARAKLMQLQFQEQAAKDQIAIEVRDALSNLDRTWHRLQKAKEEKNIAVRVTELELIRFEKGSSNLLEVNLREIAAATAELKVIDALGEFYRAMADFRAALGFGTWTIPESK